MIIAAAGTAKYSALCFIAYPQCYYNSSILKLTQVEGFMTPEHSMTANERAAPFSSHVFAGCPKARDRAV
jgi:hypothetical protein